MEVVTTLKNQKVKVLPTDVVTVQQIDDAFKELLTRTWVVFGKEINLASRGWGFGYNRRTRALGLCSRNKKMVYLSGVLVKLNLDGHTDWEDVIRHEIAHAIDYEVRGTSDHSQQWKNVCVHIGADPSRLYEGKLIKPKAKYAQVCGGCKKEFPIYRKPNSRRDRFHSPCVKLHGYNEKSKLFLKIN